MAETLNPVHRLFENAPPDASHNKLPDRMISSDSHITEPPHTYTKYIDPAFRDRAPKIVKDSDGGDGFAVEGMPVILMGGVAGAGIDPREIRRAGRRFENLHRGGWDPKARLADQDRDGIGAEVIYPSVGMVLCNHVDADYKQACMWAYNRWLHEEFVGYAPDRLIGLGQTAVRSVAEAIDDVHKMKEMGFRGVMLPGFPMTEEDYDDASFDPLWRAVVELDMPISFHILTSRSDGMPNVTSPEKAKKTALPWRGGLYNATHAVLKSIQDIIGMFVWGRIFERHPELKLVCVEADAGWLPHYAYRMDHFYDRHRYWMKMGNMSLRPSEQLARNVYLTFQDDITALEMVGRIDPTRLLWANDFPHTDSTWPWSQPLLKAQTLHLSEEDKALILRDNTAGLYGIDVAALPPPVAG
jgi:predicted TIM-barrel fold metal-dependent hydrolase